MENRVVNGMVDRSQVSEIQFGLGDRGRDRRGDSESEDQGLKYILQIRHAFRYIYFIPIVNSN